jgi:hypothetical protein
LSVAALSTLVARTLATCACVTSTWIATRRAILAASRIPLSPGSASGVTRPAIAAFSAAIAIAATLAALAAFAAAIAVAAAATIAATFSALAAFPATIAIAAAIAVAAATTSVPTASAATAASTAAGAVTALRDGCTVQDGQAGAMAEIELNPQGKSSRSACYRNEDMSPPAGHDHLMTPSMPSFASCRAAS